MIQKTEENFEECINTKNKLAFILDSLPISVYLCEAESDFIVTYISPNVVSFTGYDAKDFIENSHLWFSHIHPDDVEKITDALDHLVQNETRSFEYRWLNANGVYIWIQNSLRLIHPENGEKNYIAGMWQDITERKQMELRLQESEQRFRNITELTTDLVWQVDEHGTYVYTGEQVYDLLGYTPQEVYGKTPFDFMPPEEAKRVAAIFQQIIHDQRAFSSLKNVNLHKDGHKVILETNGVPLIDSEGVFHGYFGTEHDITARIRADEEIRLLATTDSLTGIANRREFNNQLGLEIERTKRYGTPLSLIMYDIDYFKRVNDTFGHDVGDDVLRTLTTVVKKHMRSVDIMARWGGEEFMILMLQSDVTAAANAAEKLRQEITSHVFNHVGKLTVSFGVTTYKPDDDIKTLLKRVDDALYRAKKKGRNRVEILLA